MGSFLLYNYRPVWVILKPVSKHPKITTQKAEKKQKLRWPPLYFLCGTFNASVWSLDVEDESSNQWCHIKPSRQGCWNRHNISHAGSGAAVNAYVKGADECWRILMFPHTTRRSRTRPDGGWLRRGRSWRGLLVWLILVDQPHSTRKILRNGTKVTLN